MAIDTPPMYSVEWVSTFFHGFPHIDFSFKSINSTFQPNNNNYRQSVIFWALVPVAVCCLVWLLVSIYFIACRGNKHKRRPSPCAKVITGLLIFVAAGILGLGLYENENVHHGIDSARHAAIDASTTVTNALIRISLLEKIAEDVNNVSLDMEKAVSEIADKNISKAGLELIEKIRNDSIIAQEICNEIRVDDHQKEITYATDLTDAVEYYRWVATIVIYSVYLFLCFLTTIGLLLKSRSTLIWSAVLAIIFSLLLWASAGVYLGSSVGLGDLCVEPDNYAISLVDDQYKWIATAYIKCQDSSQPYQKSIVNAQETLSKAITTLEEVQALAKPYNIKNLNQTISRMVNDLNYAMGNLSTLLSSVGMCNTLHQFYATGVEAVCDETINSTALLASVCCVLGLAFTIIIFTLSCIWRGYVPKKRTDYTHADDTDPFLPRPPPYDSDYGAVGHSSPRPWSERGSLQQVPSASTSDDQYLMTVHAHTFPDESPPPAYYPGAYGRRITNVRATTHN